MAAHYSQRRMVWRVAVLRAEGGNAMSDKERIQTPYQKVSEYAYALGIGCQPGSAFTAELLLRWMDQVSVFTISLDSVSRNWTQEGWKEDIKRWKRNVEAKALAAALDTARIMAWPDPSDRLINIQLETGRRDRYIMCVKVGEWADMGERK